MNYIEKLMNMDVSRKKFLMMAGAGILALPFISKKVFADTLIRQNNGFMFGFSDVYTANGLIYYDGSKLVNSSNMTFNGTELNLSNKNLTTTGIGSFGSLVTTVGGLTLLAGQDIRPSADSTTAINIAQADGTDFVTFDTTNKRVGIGISAPESALHLGTGYIKSTDLTIPYFIYADKTYASKVSWTAPVFINSRLAWTGTAGSAISQYRSMYNLITDTRTLTTGSIDRTYGAANNIDRQGSMGDFSTSSYGETPGSLVVGSSISVNERKTFNKTVYHRIIGTDNYISVAPTFDGTGLTMHMEVYGTRTRFLGWPTLTNGTFDIQYYGQSVNAVGYGVANTTFTSFYCDVSKASGFSTAWAYYNNGDADNFMGKDASISYFGTANDASISFDGNSLNIVANAVTATDGLELTAGYFKITGGTDIRPSADSTTAINIAQADGTDFVTFDTTNKRVGIGTNAPTQQLHIAINSTAAASVKVINTAYQLDFGVDSGSTFLQSRTAAVPAAVAPLLFYIGNAEKVRIGSDGNVGIGATAPGEKLQVSGNIRLTNDNDKIQLGTAQDATISFDGNSLNIVANSVTSTDDIIVTAGDIYLGQSDTTKTYFGAGDDAFFTYDGTNFYVDPRNVGSSNFYVYHQGNNVLESSVLNTGTGAGTYAELTARLDTGNKKVSLGISGTANPVIGGALDGGWGYFGTGSSALGFNIAATSAGSYLRFYTGGVASSYKRFEITTTGDLKIPADSKKLYLGAADDSYAEFDGNSLNIIANAVTATDALELTGGYVKSTGGILGTITTITDATYTVLYTDQTVICNRATAITITLPTAVVGQKFTIKNINTGSVTVDGDSSDTIDGESAVVLSQWDSVQLQCYIANKWGIL